MIRIVPLSYFCSAKTPRKSPARPAARVCAVLFAFVGLSVAQPHPSVVLSFHDEAWVNDTAIFLGDVASISGCSAETAAQLKLAWVGRSAPPGFSRFMTPHDVAQYTLEPSNPSLQIAVKGPERIKICTNSREIKVSDFETKIRAYLAKKIKWNIGDYTVALIDSCKSIRCLEREFETSVGGLENDRPKGFVNLCLRLNQRGKTLTLPFAVHITVKTPVLVATKTVQRGAAITPECMELDTRDITALRYAPLDTVSQLGELIAGRTISAGTILSDEFVKHKPVVTKGDIVYIAINKGAIRISVPARARENGSVGERIWVENTDTHHIFRVEIRGAKEAILSSQEAI
jgi:flagella basal body P-ring formation protein FlgA